MKLKVSVEFQKFFVLESVFYSIFSLVYILLLLPLRKSSYRKSSSFIMVTASPLRRIRSPTTSMSNSPPLSEA